MAWWTQGKVHPKVKSKFIVSFGTFFLANIKSISKPSVEFVTKEYRLINHTFNYPGTAKWNPIDIKFVCMNPSDIAFMDKNKKRTIEGGGIDTADLLFQMINNTGYYYPTEDSHFLGVTGEQTSPITTPEKASTIANSFGGGLRGSSDYSPGGSPTQDDSRRIKIQQLSTGTYEMKTKGGYIYDNSKKGRTNIKAGERNNVYVVEQWDLVNPIIKSVNFGDLAYDSDELVEYSMTITYDFAIFKAQHPYGAALPPDDPIFNTFNTQPEV